MNCRRTKRWFPYIDDERPLARRPSEHIGKYQNYGRELEEAHAVHLIFTKTEGLRLLWITEPWQSRHGRMHNGNRSGLIPFRPLLPGLVEVACALNHGARDHCWQPALLHSPAHQEEQHRAGLSLDVFQANPPGSVEEPMHASWRQ